MKPKLTERSERKFMGEFDSHTLIDKREGGRYNLRRYQ